MNMKEFVPSRTFMDWSPCAEHLGFSFLLQSKLVNPFQSYRYSGLHAKDTKRRQYERLNWILQDGGAFWPYLTTYHFTMSEAEASLP